MTIKINIFRSLKNEELITPQLNRDKIGEVRWVFTLNVRLNMITQLGPRRERIGTWKEIKNA